MDQSDMAELLPSLMDLLKGSSRDEAEGFIDSLGVALGSKELDIDLSDLRRAVLREYNLMRSRIDGPKGGRPGIVDKYVSRYNDAVGSDRSKEADGLAQEVSDSMSASSYYKFCKKAGIKPDRGSRRGRPVKIDGYIEEYNDLLEKGNRKKAWELLKRAENELSTTSFHKVRKELGLIEEGAGPGRPSKIDLFKDAYINHVKEGHPEFAESVLDYAKTKLSRSSYFKLKRQIKEVGNSDRS